MVSVPPAPHLPPGERLRRLGIAAWSIIGVLVLLYLFVQGLVRIKIIFPPLVLALLIIYLLNPLVTRLQMRGVPRGLGAALTYVVVLGGLTLLVIALIPFISDQVDDFSDKWPQFRADLIEFADESADTLNDRFGTEIDTDQLACLLGAEDTGALSIEECDEVTRDFRDQIGDQAGRLTAIGLTVLEALLVFILAPLLAFYLLVDLPHVQRDLLALVPEAHRAEVADLGAKTATAVGSFFRGQLVVAIIVGIMASFGFWIIDLEFWLLIGAIAGFTNLIPLVGPFIGGGLGLFVGSVTDGVGLGLKAALVALIVQQIDNHIISPNVMKRALNLHPVTVMLSILAGGTVAGFWGVLLGVPTVAVTKILLGHFWSTRILGAEVTPAQSTAREAAASPASNPEPGVPPKT